MALCDLSGAKKHGNFGNYYNFSQKILTDDGHNLVAILVRFLGRRAMYKQLAKTTLTFKWRIQPVDRPNINALRDYLSDKGIPHRYGEIQPPRRYLAPGIYPQIRYFKFAFPHSEDYYVSSLG